MNIVSDVKGSRSQLVTVAMLITIVVIQALILITCAVMVSRQCRRHKAYISSIAKFHTTTPLQRYDHHNLHDPTAIPKSTNLDILKAGNNASDPIMESLLKEAHCSVCIREDEGRLLDSCKSDNNANCTASSTC